jgi:hypothetical protein
MTGALTLDNAQPTRWREATAGGTNYVAFLAPATLAADRTCTFQDSAQPIPDSCVGNGSDDVGVAANSFATMDAPTGTDPVADSATDTLNWTIDAPFTLTGDSTTDTMAFGIPVQTANTFYAGPTTGAAAAPAFRALGDDDVPDTVTATNYVRLSGDWMTGPLYLTDQGSIRWMEATTSGTNHVSFTSPETLAANRVCVFQDTGSPIPDSCVGNGTDETGVSVESDPTLTNDGAVTMGSGAVDPTVLTFNSDAGTDGTLSWTGATDAFEMNGSLGIGGPPTAGYALHITKNVTGASYLTNANAHVTGVAVTRTQSDTAAVHFNAYGSSIVGTAFGQVLGGWGSLFGVTGEGLLIGTIPVGTPLLLGAGGTLAQTVTDTNTTVHGILGAAATGTATTRLGQRFGTDSAGDYGGASFTTWSADTADESPVFDVNRSKSNTPGTYTIVASGDTLGNFAFRGSDGTAFANAASISARVNGTPGANDMPGALIFSTSADGSASPTARLSIDSAGRVGVATTTLTADSRLQVAGHITSEGTAPTVSACGTTPSIYGTDTAGKVITGSGVITSCTLTFALGWSIAPVCMVGDETAIQLIRGASTTTTLIITSATAITSHLISYICIGRS